MNLTWERVSLHTKLPFVIARWGYAGHENVIVTITDDDGVSGMGEAAPNRYYGESPDTVVAALERYQPIIESAQAWSLEATDVALTTALRGQRIRSCRRQLCDARPSRAQGWPPAPQVVGTERGRRPAFELYDRDRRCRRICADE